MIDELQVLREAGVQHIGLHLRRSERPVAGVIEQIAEYILPKFHNDAAGTRDSQSASLFRHVTFLRAKQNPYLHTQIGVSEFNL
ncbi:hypothetical protein QK293_26260, partial [Pseudomonas sp. AL03]|nr:hypothetical protein [Pseudomonas sp. AL03]